MKRGSLKRIQGKSDGKGTVVATRTEKEWAFLRERERKGTGVFDGFGLGKILG